MKKARLFLVLSLLFGLAVMLGLVMILDRLPFEAVDWYAYQRVDLWHPYWAKIVFNPPWTYWLLWPVLRLPVGQIGLIRLLALLVVVGLVLKSGGKPWDVLLVTTSMPVLYLVANGNIDWLVGLAFLIEDKGLALPFLWIKPQVGGLAALAWVRERGWRILLPTLGLTGLSLLIYPAWPMQALANIQGMEGGVGLAHTSWNASLFPWSVPLGLWFLWQTWQRRDDLAGVVASLLLSPYYGYYSLSVLLALLVREKRGGRLGLLVAWLGLWWLYLVWRTT